MKIYKTAWLYTVSVVILTTFIFVGTVFAGMASYGFISSLFHLVCSFVYVYGWQVLVNRSPQILPKYFLAISVLRLMAATATLLVFCVINRSDTETIRWFSAVFVISYLVILAFDAIFFAKISNNKKVIK